MGKTTTEMQLVAVSKLIPYVNNARTHSAEQILKLRASLREFGFINPVIIDREFNVIAGHGRIMAAKEEGILEVPCVFVDYLTEAQKKAYILADNRMAMDAGWDEELLRIEIESLRDMDFNVGLTGFSEDELAELYGEVRSQDKDFVGNKKVSCVGVLGYLADSIQPQMEYHDMTSRQMLSDFITEHNANVEPRKKFTVGQVTVVDSNDSLYRYSNYETTLECIKTKLTDKLGGYLVVRHEKNGLHLDWLNIEDIGVTSAQTISFGMNLLDYAEDLSSDDIATAVIPLGAEIESEDSSADVLKTYVDIKSVNNDKNFLVSEEAYQQFGWVCAVKHWNDVNVPSNLMRKGSEWLKSNQFENITLHLTAVDLSLVNSNYESIRLGDKIRYIAKPYGMDRIFPVLKLMISLAKPAETKIELGETKLKGYIEQTQRTYSGLKEEAESNRKITNAKIKDAVDNLTSQMQNGHGGYKLTEYDEEGRWVRDLYMDTMDKDTATKVLQVNLNGIGGSKNGYAGPYNVGMTLDGQILGERIVAGSVTAEKLSVSYTSR